MKYQQSKPPIFEVNIPFPKEHVSRFQLKNCHHQMEGIKAMTNQSDIGDGFQKCHFCSVKLEIDDLEEHFLQCSCIM